MLDGETAAAAGASRMGANCVQPTLQQRPVACNPPIATVEVKRRVQTDARLLTVVCALSRLATTGWTVLLAERLCSYCLCTVHTK